MRGVRMGIVLLVAVAGCGGPERVPVYPVSGRVTINGKPPVGWVVMLHFENPPASLKEYPHPLPRAEVAADGRFQFSTYETNDGAPAGKYKISFVNSSGLNDRKNFDAKDDKSYQVYWPELVEVRPEPNEWSTFDIKR